MCLVKPNQEYPVLVLEILQDVGCQGPALGCIALKMDLCDAADTIGTVVIKEQAINFRQTKPEEHGTMMQKGRFRLGEPR